MEKIDEEIRRWKELLESGEITEDAYNEEINKIIQRKQFLENKQKKISKNLKLIMLVLACIIATIIIYMNYTGKEYEEVASLTSLQPPKQDVAEGEAYKVISGGNVHLKYLYSYVLQGRVVGTQKYIKYNLFNTLMPLDIGVTWGFLADEWYDSKITWISKSNRFLDYRVKDFEWLDKIGGYDRISAFSSNNHLIPSNDEIEKLMSKIKVGDYIKIEGYLVKVSMKEGERYSSTISSTNRYDTGAGACEVIYVTDIKWLKEKP